MNWRNTSKGQDHFYDHPATQLFPNFTEWFGYLKGRGLRTVVEYLKSANRGKRKATKTGDFW